MAKYPIIPSSEFFESQSTTLATPDRFNAIFRNINSNGVSVKGFIRPVQIMSDYIGVGVDETGTPAVDTITFEEVGSALAPLDDGGTGLYDISYSWSSVGSVGSATGATTDSGFSVYLGGGTVDPKIDDIKVSLDITYTDSETNAVYSHTAESGIPLIAQGVQGDPAIESPIPLLYAAFNHQPIDLSTNTAHFVVENVSMIPTDWGSAYTYEWLLKDKNGALFNQYITSSSISSAVLDIEDTNKEFILELSIDKGSTVYSTSVNIFTYKNGVLFLNWDTDRVPSNPDFVTVKGRNTVYADNKFPVSFGSMEVKWGIDSSDFGTIGFESFGSNSEAIQAALVEAFGSSFTGASEDSRIYGVLCLNNTSSILNQHLFIPNLTNPVTVIEDVSGILSNLETLSTNLNGFSKAYLVQGLPITQQLSGLFSSNVSIGPGAERYYIHLKHFEETENGTYAYTGLHDQFLTQIPNQEEHNVSAVFNNVATGSFFKATVVSAIGSVYASGLTSTDVNKVPAGTPKEITSIEAEGTQFGVIANLLLDDSVTENPVGYLICYKEYDISTIIPPNSYNFKSDGSNEFNVIYSISPHIQVPATLGKKVVIWAQTVMSDGTRSTPVSSDDITISFPASVDQSLLTKHLGRFNGTLAGATTNWETTWENDVPEAYMYSTHFSSFAKDTLLMGVTVWIHNMDSISDDYSIYINTGGDEHELITTIGATGGVSPDPVRSYYIDLGKVQSAGEPISINVRNGSGAETLGTLANANVDITAEIVYAYSYEAANVSFSSSGNQGAAN